MTITTDRTNAQAAYDTAIKTSKIMHFGMDGASKADKSAAMPIMPTADDYRHGIDQLRAKSNCPLLCPEHHALKEELAAQPPIKTETAELPTYARSDSKAAAKRESVAEYLKKQHREAMLQRMPYFEQDTNDALYELRRDVTGLDFRLMITNWILAATIVIAVLMSLV